MYTEIVIYLVIKLHHTCYFCTLSGFFPHRNHTLIENVFLHTFRSKTTSTSQVKPFFHSISYLLNRNNVISIKFLKNALTMCFREDMCTEISINLLDYVIYNTLVIDQSD